MITSHDRRTGELFDAWGHIGSKRRALLDRGWSGVFRQHLLESLPIEELAKGFSADMGRPSKDLPVVLGALILQQESAAQSRQAIFILICAEKWILADL